MDASAQKIAFHIDHPSNWDSLTRYLLIRGWCFEGNGNSVQAIRLKINQPALIFYGLVGKARPDVRAAIPAAPDDNTGFEIRVVLPSGKITFSLEVQLTGGAWHSFIARTVTIRSRWLPLWLSESSWEELMLSQIPSQMEYPPRNLPLVRFPKSTTDQARWPKLSIASPSFQQARYLPDTIRSVLEQSQEVRCEYVIHDGGSTDGSVEVIRRSVQQKTNFKNTESIRVATGTDACLVTWTSEPDAGQADAIARAFAKTSGSPSDLMAWINSDDFYLPGTFAFVADFFARYPDVDVIYGHRLLVDENSREIGRWFLPEHDDEVLKLYDFVPQETMFWRRRIWDKVGGLDQSYKFAMDWDLLLRFQAAGAKIVRVPHFLACFRIHQAQKTSAQMNSIGQKEIDSLRRRALGREITPEEIETHPKLLGYLRRSAWIRFLWRLGIRV